LQFSASVSRPSLACKSLAGIVKDDTTLSNLTKKYKLKTMKKTLSLLTVGTIILLTLTQCKKDCLKSDRCKLEPDAGNCFATIPKYYYDKKVKKCKEFTWGGCGGVVPFETLEECERQCDCK
jgi:hypothetical protein